MRILVVDDDERPRQRLVSALSQAGHAVVEASTGRVALAQLVGQEVDLIITDVVMPELDGFELMRELRRAASSVKLIVLSESDFSQEEVFIKIARVLGATAAFRKSVDPGVILGAVDRIAAESARHQAVGQGC